MTVYIQFVRTYTWIMEAKVRRVTRSDLRQNQSAVLSRVARGHRVLVTSRSKDDRPVYIVDKEYLDQLTTEVESLVETLEILMDQPLAARMQRLKSQVKKSPKSIKLVPFDEAFSKL